MWLFENTGSREAPELAAGQQIIGPGSAFSNDPEQATRGMRAKICVTDYNGDGLLDILLGDFCSQRISPSPQEQERIAALQEKAQAALAEYSQLQKQLRQTKEQQARAELRKKMAEKLAEYRTAYEQIRVNRPLQRTYHGRVWLFLKKRP